MKRIRKGHGFKISDWRDIQARRVSAGSKRPNAGFFALLALILGLWSTTEASEGAEAGGLAVVKTIQPQKVDLQRTTTQPGTVHAYYEAELYAKVSGYLKALHVDIGDEVEAGKSLAEIDVPEMQKNSERQQAEVVRLRSDTRRLEAMVEVAEARRVESEFKLKEAEAQMVADRSEYNRVEELVQSKAVTRSLRDEALNRSEASKAAFAAKKSSVNVSQALLKSARAGVECAVAAEAVAQKQFEEIEVMLSYSTLRAPFTGIVTQRNVDPGDLVHNAQTSRGDEEPLFTIAQIDKVRVRVAIPERDAVWVKAGDKALFKIAALPGAALAGDVTRVSKSLDPLTRSMLVEIELPNSDGSLLPGMFGQVVISSAVQPDSIVLPAECLRNSKDGSETHVYVVDANNTIQHVPVTLGLDDGIQIEIVEGLTGQERVVTGILGRLAPGQSVRVIE